jgi:SET domain-containing protein
MLLLPKDSWEVRESGNKGRGIFTKKTIVPGTIIGDYIGKMIKASEEDRYEKKGHFYLMYYSDYATIFPDPTKPGIHLLNHSCTPNTWMYTYRGHTLYFALRTIFPGEELTVSYLLSPQDKDCNPCTHLCHCDSIICYTTMHLSQKRYDAWITYHDKEAEKTKREPIRYGEALALLDDYPKIIPDHPVYTLFGSFTNQSLRIDERTVPAMKDIRSIIRESGRSLAFPHLNLRIYGVLDNALVTKTLSV